MVTTSARSRNTTLRDWLVLGAAMLALMALFAAWSATVSAQEEPALPAHIHPGTCETLDPNPIAPLSDVGTEFLSDGTATAGEAVGSGSVNAVEGSTSTVELSLDDILAADHAINVHASAEDVDTYIACGNVAGAMVGDSLVIGLGEQNDSGHTGVAILTPDGERTVVAVYLTYAQEADEGDGSPAADAVAGEEVAIDIVDFAFAPAELTVPVGTTVTWTNNDSVPHTATAEDGSFSSDTLNQGDSFSFTFDTPGTFTYVCALHPDMTATITVE